MPVATYFTWHGANLEGRGVSPALEEPFSFEASLHGRDNQLERALRTLRDTPVTAAAAS
jgi:C-terminal processing protease CtpA/Prc